MAFLKNPLSGFNSRDYILGLVLTLVSIQIMSWVITWVASLAGKDVAIIHIGPALLLLLVGVAIVVVWKLTQTYSNNHAIARMDVFMLLLIVGGVIATYYFLPKMVPEMFEGAVVELKVTIQSMLPSITR